jgi:putative NADH-flavin reductase
VLNQTWAEQNAPDQKVDRGHTVVAAARTPENVQKLKNVSAVQDDLRNPAKTASIVKGADSVVSAYGPPPDDLCAQRL